MFGARDADNCSLARLPASARHRGNRALGHRKRRPVSGDADFGRWCELQSAFEGKAADECDKRHTELRQPVPYALPFVDRLAPHVQRIRHAAGVAASRCIITIDRDAVAPFLKVADYGVVGDLFEAVPALTTAIRALQGG